MVESRTFGRVDRGSKPPVVRRASDFSVEGTWVQNHLRRFEAERMTGKWKIPAVHSLILENENPENKPLLC